MFEGEEFKSYIQLCRELRLEREFEEGDWFCSLAGYVSPTLPGTPMLVTKSELRLMAVLKSPEHTAGLVWLPSLAQWLSMLEEAGHRDVLFAPYKMVRWAVRLTKQGGVMDFEGATREEAAAQAWVSVTGRTVTSG